jgi:hypothetical protein
LIINKYTVNIEMRGVVKIEYLFCPLMKFLYFCAG